MKYYNCWSNQLTRYFCLYFTHLLTDWLLSVKSTSPGLSFQYQCTIITVRNDWLQILMEFKCICEGKQGDRAAVIISHKIIAQSFQLGWTEVNGCVFWWGGQFTAQSWSQMLSAVECCSFKASKTSWGTMWNLLELEGGLVEFNSIVIMQ